MNSLILLEGVHHKLVWGTEDWIISAHQNGDNKVVGSDMTLSNYFEENRELFGSIDTLFPLLVKIIDAKDDLSIQVHPADEYAKKHENSLGKTECWYVLDCDDDADIIISIDAKNRQELAQIIQEDNIESTLNVIKVQKGDFFFIPAGCVHAIRKNTKILEVQQSSDITYRLYDYNRPGIDGNMRELHIEKSLDVIDYDFKLNHAPKAVRNVLNSKITTLIDSTFFTVEILDIKQEINFVNKFNYLLCVALDEVVVNGELIKKNQGFIAPTNVDLDIKGSGQVVVSYIK